MIYMQILALKTAKLIRREGGPNESGVFWLEEHFRDYPFNMIDRLYTKRWFNLTD
jgi:hypothetical protein